MGSISGRVRVAGKGRVRVAGKTNWLRCRWVRVCRGRKVFQSLSGSASRTCDRLTVRRLFLGFLIWISNNLVHVCPQEFPLVPVKEGSRDFLPGLPPVALWADPIHIMTEGRC